MLPTSANHLGFTVYSFSWPGAQQVECLKVSGDPLRQCAQMRESGSATVVEIGETRSSSRRLFSDSFRSCTPVLAFYGDGRMLLHHSAAFDTDTLDGLLRENPTDVYVVARTGRAATFPRQGANAAYVVNHAPTATNVHIVEVADTTIAVDVRPGNISIWHTSPSKA